MNMKVITHGTRGSVPIANKNAVKYGGNTTCLEIQSSCLPENQHLVIDAGSGFVPYGSGIMKLYGKGINDREVKIHLLFTHYHHDHTQGLFISPLAFNKKVDFRLYGPVDHGVGPQEMFEAMMVPPFFPVHYNEQASHFHFKKLEFPASMVIIFHPKGGSQITSVEQFEKMEKDGGHVQVGRAGKYPISECLVVRMYKSNHPEQTVSYRLEERPTGKVFVLLTDHENQSAIPGALRRHLTGADLLVIDCQYSQEKYEKIACGFGHSTGAYCAKLAYDCQVKKVGLTHHDPEADDAMVEANVEEAKSALVGLLKSAGKAVDHPSLFACADYQSIEV